MLTEADRVSVKPQILQMLLDVEKYLFARRGPDLFPPGEDDDEECEAGAGAGQGAAHSAEQPAKRSRKDLVKGVDCCTMAVDGDNLQITDTGRPSSKAAHKFILRLVRDKSLRREAQDEGLSFFYKMLAAVSTPFAAFYVDMNNGVGEYENSYAVCQEAMEHCIRQHLAKRVVGLKMKFTDQFSLEFAYKGYKKTATQQEIADRINDIVAHTMDKIVRQASAVRSKWQARTVKLVRTNFLEVEPLTKPYNPYALDNPCPKVMISTRLLPAEILPPAGLRPQITQDTSSATEEQVDCPLICYLRT